MLLFSVRDAIAYAMPCALFINSVGAKPHRDITLAKIKKEKKKKKTPLSLQHEHRSV